MRKSQSDPLRQDRVEMSMHVSAQPRVVEVLDNTRSVCEKEAQDDDKAYDQNSRSLICRVDCEVQQHICETWVACVPLIDQHGPRGHVEIR